MVSKEDFERETRHTFESPLIVGQHPVIIAVTTGYVFAPAEQTRRVYDIAEEIASLRKTID